MEHDSLVNTAPPNPNPGQPPVQVAPPPAAWGQGGLSGPGADVIPYTGPIINRDYGPVDDTALVTIQLPDGKNWVKTKRYITEEDDERANQAALRNGIEMTGGGQNGNRAARRAASKNGNTGPEKTVYHFDTAAQKMVLLTRLIKEWSFVDAYNRPIPVTSQNIAALPAFTTAYIMDKVGDMNPLADIPDPDAEEEDIELDANGEQKGPLGLPMNDS